VKICLCIEGSTGDEIEIVEDDSEGQEGDDEDGEDFDDGGENSTTLQLL